MAPSFPVTVTVELAFGADPEADPSGWSWTDVSSDVRYADRVRIGRGRSDERSDAEPSQCSFTLLNDSGDYTPGNATGAHYPDVVLGAPVRVTVTTDSVDYRRFSGFVSRWLPEWPEGDLSPPFALVRVTCDGVLRRMRQGEQSLDSPLHRALSNHDNIVAYWPCEDGSEATQAASPIMGVSPMVPSGVTFGASREQSDSILYGASSVMQIPDGARNMLGRVPNHTRGDVYVVSLAWLMPETATANRLVIDAHTTSSTVAEWQVMVSSTQFLMRQIDPDGAIVDTDTEAVGDVFGRWVRAELRLNEDTGLASAHLFALDADETELNDVSASSVAADGRIVRVGVGRSSDQERYAAHIVLLTGTADELPLHQDIDPPRDWHPPYHAHTGELAADRFERLCDEQDLQCSISAPTGGLRDPSGDVGDNATAPDAAGLDITGDLELRCLLSADDWNVDGLRDLVDKWDAAGNERSYFLELRAGAINFAWSTDGSDSPNVVGQMAPIPGDSARQALRVTLDVDNGASGHDVTMYHGPSLDGPWTQFHSETLAGTTSVHAGTAVLRIMGTTAGFAEGVPVGVVHAMRLYDGIGGTVVADPDFEAQDVGTTSFADDAGNTWTVNGDAAIVRADDSMPMGPQPVDTLTNQFKEVEVADGGIVGEDDFGLFYRTRTDLENQSAALSLDADTDLVNPFRPALDDLGVVNDVTATRPNGTSVRAVDSDHVTDHGRYSDAVDLNVSTDDWLLQVAYWLLHLCICEDMRYPRVSPALTRTPTLITSWGVLDEGDLVTVTDLPAEHPAGTVEVLARGWSEELSPDEWLATVNASPAGPYDVAVFGTARFDAADSSTSAGLLLDGTSGDYASTPDAASLDITGDIDLRCDATLDDWASTAQTLIAKYDTGTNNRSYQLLANAAGTLSLVWSTDGSAFINEESTTTVPVSSGRLAVRATLDVDDGGSGYEVTFYTADSIDGSWTQLGNTVDNSGGGTTSIFAGTASLNVGARDNDGGANVASGVIHAAEVLDGIGGTLVADPDFTAETTGTTSFSDSTGKTWTVNGSASLFGDLVAGTDTSILVVTTDGSRPWINSTDHSAEFPVGIEISGVTFNCTGITGSASPQVATVDATPTNGVEKTIASGSKVRLASPAVFAL